MASSLDHLVLSFRQNYFIYSFSRLYISQSKPYITATVYLAHSHQRRFASEITFKAVTCYAMIWPIKILFAAQNLTTLACTLFWGQGSLNAFSLVRLLRCQKADSITNALHSINTMIRVWFALIQESISPKTSTIRALTEVYALPYSQRKGNSKPYIGSPQNFITKGTESSITKSYHFFPWQPWKWIAGHFVKP